MKTPCINICKINPHSKLCEGCKRTIDEIAEWIYLTDKQRETIIKELRTR